jgi:hypothetical protein
MNTDQVHFMYNQFQPLYSFFMAFNFPLENCLNMRSFELFICGHSAPLCTGHILAAAGEREVNLIENRNIKPFA